MSFVRIYVKWIKLHLIVEMCLSKLQGYYSLRECASVLNLSDNKWSSVLDWQNKEIT